MESIPAKKFEERVPGDRLPKRVLVRGDLDDVVVAVHSRERKGLTMYLISDDTLDINDFKRSGTVTNISPTDFVQEFDDNVRGFVVYIMRVKGEFMKGGKAHGKTPGALYAKRVADEFNCLRPWKKCCPAGPPYSGDPWHLHALPAVRTTGVVVELFAKTHDTEEKMLENETELNDFYRGLWTRQGKPTWKQPKRHRTTVSTLRLERQAV